MLLTSAPLLDGMVIFILLTVQRSGSLMVFGLIIAPPLFGQEAMVDLGSACLWSL